MIDNTDYSALWLTEREGEGEEMEDGSDSADVYMMKYSVEAQCCFRGEFPFKRIMGQSKVVRVSITAL